MRILNYILLAFMVLALVFYIGSKSKPYQTISGKTMGTYYNIKVKTNTENNLLNSEVKSLLDEIVSQYSVFDSNSELSKINKDTSGEWIELSPNMTDVMKRAYDIYKSTEGVFDPTIGKLVDLWGFGESKVAKMPAEEEIKEVLEYTGFNKIKFSNDFKRLKKTHPNIYINLSAIAKGYGVDKVAEFLQAKGYEDFIIEIGGEIRAQGQKAPDVDGWIVGILKPLRDKNENAFVVTLKNMSAATSGDYRNFYDLNGEIISHTIDTKTGYPIKNNVSSVTVFDKTCTDADAYATAIIAMGGKKGLKFANTKKLAVLIFVKNPDDSFEVLISDRASRILTKK